MSERYHQFLGSKPGLVVELLDESSSPHRLRTEEGFEYFVSADDFRNYYKKLDTPTPERWSHLVTDLQTGMVDSVKMSEVLAVVQNFVDRLQDYEKARSFVRETIRIQQDCPTLSSQELIEKLLQAGWNIDGIEDRLLDALIGLPDDLKALLLSDTCGVVQALGLSSTPRVDNGEPWMDPRSAPSGEGGSDVVRAPTGPQTRRAGMKNVEMTVDGDMLTLVIDLSKEFGPSKSGKTIIIASTEGNKSVPGRTEKVGLNIYKEEGKKPSIGRKSSFKNVEMALDNDLLTVTVDLSKEFGPSKSGKTIIIGSTEGNQRVLGRPEKIGLNVYRKID